MARIARLTVIALALACARAQYEDDDRSTRYISAQTKSTPPPPVAILKQINRHNEDGSYTYGYEGGDGSFKIETKSPTGEVKGKYGYKDDTGKLRVVEYGANKFGFQPAGEGITVAPPTLVDESERDQDDRPSRKQQPSRSQYRAPAAPQQQAVDYDYEEAAPPAPAPPAYRAPQPAYRPSAQPGPKPRPLSIPGAAPAPLDRASFFTPSQSLQGGPPAPRVPPAPRAPKQQQFSFEPFQQQQQPQPQIQYTQDFQPNPPQQRYTAPASPAQYQQQSQFQQPRQFQPQGQQPFSMLDQLLKEYALPQGGAAPLHDITFGTY